MGGGRANPGMTTRSLAEPLLLLPPPPFPLNLARFFLERVVAVPMASGSVVHSDLVNMTLGSKAPPILPMQPPRQTFFLCSRTHTHTLNSLLDAAVWRGGGSRSGIALSSPCDPPQRVST